jgi:hypothetical protein
MRYEDRYKCSAGERCFKVISRHLPGEPEERHEKILIKITNSKAKA